MEATDNLTDPEDEAEEGTDSRMTPTEHETGMSDQHEDLLVGSDSSESTSCTQDKELHVDQLPGGPSVESSRETCDSTDKGDDSSLSFTIKEKNNPDKMLYVYKKSTDGSDVTINVVSMISVNETTSVVALQSGLDTGTELQVEEKAGATEDAEDSSGSRASNVQEYTCNHCDFTTNKKHLWLSHEILHVVPDNKHLYYCSQCSYSTRQRFNLKTHVKSHFDIKEMDPSELFKCTQCDYVSMYKYDLQTHSKKHDPDKRHKCFYCDFSSIYRHSLLHHISSKHHGVRPFQCSLCSFSAAKKSDLETHLFKHDNEKRYQCSECDYKTTYKQCLESHMNTHKGDKPFQCTQPGCTFSTNSKSNLNSHLAMHKKRSRCESCGYESMNAERLQNHTCLETQKKREINERIRMAQVAPPSKKEDGKLEYRCPECGYVSTSKHSMKRHSMVHNDQRERPDKVHQCIHCDYVTAYKSSLTRHMARHSLVKPLKCGHCDYSTITMTQMHAHVAKHTGIKQFACDLCTYRTANKQHLKNHMSKHSNLRYKCNACGHITAWKDRMRLHLKQHERGQIFVRSVKPSPRPLPIQTLTTDCRLVTTDGQVLEVLNVLNDDSIKTVEGSETLITLNELADRIQNSIREDEGQGKTFDQDEDMDVVQKDGDMMVVGGEEIVCDQQDQTVGSEMVSQGDGEEGTITIVTDEGSDLRLHLSGDAESSKSRSVYNLEFSNESSITVAE
ncbi:zinc finger protein 808-like [Lytechinus pictus]|uniref:zinc finger protein 808-like n=1 Tax=Lytechinus pictus TaxID=7653 RepID=UPI0030B9F0A2